MNLNKHYMTQANLFIESELASRSGVSCALFYAASKLLRVMGSGVLRRYVNLSHGLFQADLRG